MVTAKLITIEVAYATSEKQCILELQVKENTTLLAAIQQSGILQMFPTIDLTKQKVGVFSNKQALSAMVHENERIEIYRPLLMDPKEARKKRVKKRSS